MSSVTYLDNNGTTMASPAALEAMWEWMNRGNPSARYPSAVEAKRMMEKFRAYVAERCEFSLKEFQVVFTSGGSESNCQILLSTVRAYRSRTGVKPRVVTSEVEHSSVMKCCKTLSDMDEADICYLPVAKDPAKPNYGTVSPADLERELAGEDGARTCLVSIMAANNETGAINPINDLALRAYEAKVPFHTDAVQIFGKTPIYPNGLRGEGPPIDAISVSFHKLEGPTGCGLLIVRKSLVEGYGLCPLICGAQNGGFRGGTENVPAIAASFRAYKEAMDGRRAKNAELVRLTNKAFAALSKTRATPLSGTLADFLEDRVPYDPRAGPGSPAGIVWIRGGSPGGGKPAMLPNTLLVAVVHPLFCNLKAQDALGKRDVYVGIGSTCNTDGAAEPSHVVKALGIPDELRPGILRISFGDGSKDSDVAALVAAWEDMFRTGDCFTD
jgi:cysteine desulfurase